MDSSMLLRLDLEDEESTTLASILRKLLATDILNSHERDVAEAILRAMEGLPSRLGRARGIERPHAQAAPHEQRLMMEQSRGVTPSDTRSDINNVEGRPWRRDR
jgi:hypothetical protein